MVCHIWQIQNNNKNFAIAIYLNKTTVVVVLEFDTASGNMLLEC